MSVVIGVVIAAAALAGATLGGRHLYLRVDRPGGFECSLRAVQGHVPGLTHRFRAGYAGREPSGFLWRRLAWPSPPVRLPSAGVRLHAEHIPGARDRLIAVPAHFTVLPITLDDGAVVDLALSRRQLRRVIEASG